MSNVEYEMCGLQGTHEAVSMFSGIGTGVDQRDSCRQTCEMQLRYEYADLGEVL